MFQSAITSREYEHFVEVCKRSKEDAIDLMIKYTNTDQAFLQEVIDHIWGDGDYSSAPFSHRETLLQEQISQGKFKNVLDEGHHKVGHF